MTCKRQIKQHVHPLYDRKKSFCFFYPHTLTFCHNRLTISCVRCKGRCEGKPLPLTTTRGFGFFCFLVFWLLMGFLGLQLLLLYLVDVGRHIVGMDLGEGVSKVKQSVLFKLLTHSLYKNIVSQGCMPPIIEQQLSSSYHRYTSRYSIPWLEQTIADHLLNSELPPQHR